MPTWTAVYVNPSKHSARLAETSLESTSGASESVLEDRCPSTSRPSAARRARRRRHPARSMSATCLDSAVRPRRERRSNRRASRSVRKASRSRASDRARIFAQHAFEADSRSPRDGPGLPAGHAPVTVTSRGFLRRSGFNRRRRTLRRTATPAEPIAALTARCSAESRRSTTTLGRPLKTTLMRHL